MIQAIDYTVLNDLAMKALAAKERILKAHITHSPVWRLEKALGLFDTATPPGDESDYKIIREWQSVVTAFAQLEFEQVRRALEELKLRDKT